MRSLAFSLALWSVAALGAETKPQNLIGTVRPDFEFPDLNGRAIKNSAWDGRVVVLNFWATWCAPCRTEIPMLNTLAKAYAPLGVEFVGVAVDYKPAVTKFIATIPIEYTVLIGGLESTQLVKRFGDRGGVLPYTAVIDRNGKIAALAAGALTEDYVRGALDKLLRTPAARLPPSRYGQRDARRDTADHLGVLLRQERHRLGAVRNIQFRITRERHGIPTRRQIRDVPDVNVG